MNKGYLALLIVAVVLTSGVTYAATQIINTTRVTINKPFSLSTVANPESLFGIRWSDRDLDQEQNITGVTRINGDVFSGDTVTINGTMVNSGSKDLALTWSTESLPKGLTLQLYVDGKLWTDSIMIDRSTSLSLSVRCVDDGTLVEGRNTFDLVITAQ